MKRSLVPRGGIGGVIRLADDDDRPEIRVGPELVMVWGVRGGRVYHFYIRGKDTLRELAEAIIEAQGG